jgi:hypothetical protein
MSSRVYVDVYKMEEGGEVESKRLEFDVCDGVERPS